MADTLLFRGGSSASIDVASVQSREIVIDTDTDQIVSGASKKKTVMEDSSGNVNVTGSATFDGPVVVNSTNISTDDFHVSSPGGRTTLSINADSGQDTRLAFKRATTYRFAFVSDAADLLSINNASFNKVVGFSQSGSISIGGTIPSAPNVELNGNGNITAAGDVICTSNSKGLILKSPDGTSFRLSVANDGTLSASSI